MAVRSEPGVTEKEFEHCEITWKIKNYFLATYGESWTINSPEIYVTEPKTKWKMFLTPDPTDKKSRSIHLQRLEYDSGLDSVWASWRMALIAKKDGFKKEYHKLDERKRSFKINEQCVDVLKQELILEHMVPPFNDKDTFYIQCHLIVSRENVDETYMQFDRDFDLTILQNFIQKHAVGKKYDVEIVNKNHKIKAHKVVLSSRCRYFENQINRDKECVTFDIDRMGFSNIIAYLYSGDLKHVLSKPCVHLYDMIRKLKIDELDLYYLPSRMKLNTALDVQYDEFRWVIENISDRTDGTIITSPIIYDGSSRTCWKLELKIKLVKKNICMSISAESMAHVDRMHLFIELVPLNNRRDCFPRARMIDIKDGVVIYTNEEFLEIEKSKIRSSLPGNMLHIIFRLQILLTEKVLKSSSRSAYFLSK